MLNVASCECSKSVTEDDVKIYINGYIAHLNDVVENIKLWPSITALVISALLCILFVVNHQHILAVIFCGLAIVMILVAVYKRHSITTAKAIYNRELSNKDRIQDGILEKLNNYNAKVQCVYDSILEMVNDINDELLSFIGNAQELVLLLERHVERLSVKTFDKEKCDEILYTWSLMCQNFDSVMELEAEINNLQPEIPSIPTWTDSELLFTNYRLVNCAISKVQYKPQTFFGDTKEAIAMLSELDDAYNFFEQLKIYYDSDVKPNSEIVNKIKSLEKKTIVAIKKCYHDSNTKAKMM